MTTIDDVLSGRARWALAQGDCLDLLRSLPDACVDAVVTDPPYGTTRNKWDTPFDLAAWWAQVERVAKRDAAIVVFAQTPFDKVLGASRVDLLRYEWIWRKERGTGHLRAKLAPMKDHENILVFYRSPPPYQPQMREGEPYERAHGSNGHNYNDRRVSLVTRSAGGRYPLSVLEFARDTPRIHPTQKPVNLLAYLLRTYCAPGAVVLDPFTGSGTTGVAAMREGLRFVGVEREPAYAEIARARIAAAAEPAQGTLSGAA